MSAGPDQLRLFDYGSLMQGERDHALLSSATFVGAVRTAAAFHLVDLGIYAALIADGDVSVTGELYIVDRKCLFGIDVAKQCSVLFERRPITLEDGSTAQAYLMPEERVRGKRRLKGGSWRDRFAPAPRDKTRSAFIEALRKR